MEISVGFSWAPEPSWLCIIDEQLVLTSRITELKRILRTRRDFSSSLSKICQTSAEDLLESYSFLSDFIVTMRF